MHERDILLAAIEKVLPAEREEYLREVCGEDASMRSRIEALLRASEVADSFLERPALDTEVLASKIDDVVNEASEHDRVDIGFLEPPVGPNEIGRLGKYTITEVIGRGGMGIVLKGRDTQLERVVAIKVLAPELAANASARKRFLREAHAVAAVSHDHVVTIFAIEAEKLPFLVMEYVNGQSLQEKLDRHGPLELKEILRIGMQTAFGLSAAHAQGIVHRDIKPANILLQNGIERVQITDFGLARAADDVHITRTGEVAGTPQYMSPEQAQGLPIDARSDLFSLGVVLYAMSTGRPPFRADSTPAVLHRVCHDTPRPIQEINPEIPQWLTVIIERLLQKDPADRYSSAKEVAELLGQYLAHVQQPALVSCPGNPLASPRPHAALRFRQLQVAVVALLAVAVAFTFTEAAGVTKVVPTVIRIAYGEGTLIIEVDDPTVQVSLDGEELRIRGAGLQEFRLVSGKYRLHATKDGQPVRDEVVTVTRDGRQVVSVTLESSGDADSSGVVAPRSVMKVHARWVESFSFSPDGTTLASSAQDQRVRLWNLATGDAKGLFETGDNNGVSAVAWSPDGSILITGSLSSKVKVWNSATFKMLAEVKHDDWVWAVAFRRRDSQLATSSRDKTVKLWKWDGKELALVRKLGHASGVSAMAYSPDGTKIAAATAEGMLHVWDVESGEELNSARVGWQTLRGLAFFPDGSTIAVGGYDKRIDLLKVDTLKSAGTLRGHQEWVWSLAFLPDGKTLVSGGGQFDFETRTSNRPGELILWDIDSMQKRLSVRAHEKGVRCVALSADGKTLATGDFAGMGRLWDVAALLAAANAPLSPSISSAASAAAERSAYDSTLLAKLDGHTDIVRGVAFVADGKRIVSVGRDRKVQIWDSKTHHLLSTLPVEGYLRDATVSLDGRHVAVVATVGEKKSMAQIWDLEKRERLWELPQDFNYVHSIRLSPNGARMVTSGNPPGGILWDLTTGKELKRLDIGVTPVTQAATFSSDGRMIALGAVGRVRLFDAESGDVLSDIRLPEDRNVNDLVFMATGKTLACGQASGNVHLIDMDARRVRKSLKASNAPVVRMRLLGNDRFLLVTCFDATLRLLDIERGTVVATTATEKGTNERLAVSPDGRYAVTASGEDWDSNSGTSNRNGDYAVRLWQLPESVWTQGSPEQSAETVKPPVPLRNP